MNIHVDYERLIRYKGPFFLTMALVWLSGCGTTSVPVKQTVNDAQYKRLARDVFSETNRLRTEPDVYLRILKDIRQRIAGKVYQPQGSKVRFVTEEGVSVVNEAVNVLGKQKPMRKLQWSDALAELARKHVEDTGAKGIVSHNSSSGQSFSERVSSVIAKNKFTTASENIAYGYNNGMDVVSQLFIDDGVQGRGHRKNLLKRQLTHTGVACGYHRKYGHMCTAIYAAQ